MEHSLWVIGENRIIALDEIRSVTPSKDDCIVMFKDGSKMQISTDESSRLVGAILRTQGGHRDR